MAPRTGERQALLSNHRDQQEPNVSKQQIDFEDDDPDNPRNWPQSKKWTQVAQIIMIALICPMSSSIIAAAQSEIRQDFGVSNEKLIIAAQSGFVCMLGIGPLFLAPMSETFGRRKIFLINLILFTLLQIPTALAPDAVSFVVLRTLSGLCGSVGVANGGGSLSDMYQSHERAQVLGVYLLAPLLGPSLGPLVGGLIVSSTSWRWIFWLLLGLGSLASVVAYFFLYETRAITILQQRKKHLERKSPSTEYYIKGDSDQGLLSKIASTSTRAIKILTTQPIVLTMSIYQALVFSSMYSLYASYPKIWSTSPYNFSKAQIGLAYLGPAIGFVVTSIFIVYYIDRLFTYLSEINNDDGAPEYRLPMANIGAVFLPISLFWLGWTIEAQLSWPIPLAATLLFGASQVSIFNTVQTYYIDAYEGSAASALAAGAFLRSVAGGVIPLLVGGMFDALGYGWGMSVFGLVSVVLMPAPLLFYFYGKRLRERFPFDG